MGFRVLAVDWDLDAPGLWRYFKLPMPHAGLLELVQQCATEHRSTTDNAVPNSRDWRHSIITAVFPSLSGELDLLTAG